MTPKQKRRFTVAATKAIVFGLEPEVVAGWREKVLDNPLTPQGEVEGFLKAIEALAADQSWCANVEVEPDVMVMSKKLSQMRRAIMAPTPEKQQLATRMREAMARGASGDAAARMVNGVYHGRHMVRDAHLFTVGAESIEISETAIHAQAHQIKMEDMMRQQLQYKAYQADAYGYAIQQAPQEILRQGPELNQIKDMARKLFGK